MSSAGQKTDTDTSNDSPGAPKTLSGAGDRGNSNPQNNEYHAFRKSHSNESDGSGGSKHSSSMLSIGNSSFGFTFDNDPMMQLGGSSSGAPSERNSEGDNSDNSEKPRKSSPTDASAVAEANVANLQLLARSQMASSSGSNEASRKRSQPEQAASSQVQYARNLGQNDESVDGHYADEDDDDDDGNNSRSTTDQQDGATQPKRKKKRLDERKRVERNAREKERSFRISKQINELRNLLSSGGVIVPKGTKSSVLTEAANYIRMLQQHQYRSEM